MGSSTASAPMAIFDHKKFRTVRFLSTRYLVGAAITVGALTVGGYFYWGFRVIGTLVTSLRMGQYDPGEIVLQTTSK